MRIAAVSDIHGNLAALDAVLADAARRGVDQIVNLGDIVSGPLNPRETADRLMALALPTIRGNHERQVLTQSYEEMGASDRFASAALRPNQLGWLAGLPETAWLSGDVLMVHGTPDSDLEYFLETVTEDGLREATRAEVEERSAGIDAEVILCGHTHVPRVTKLRDGRLIVNPGSVGLPAYADNHPFPHRVENGTPHARYGILEQAEGTWSAELIMVEYDWSSAADAAGRNGQADWTRPLRTGLV